MQRQLNRLVSAIILSLLLIAASACASKSNTTSTTSPPSSSITTSTVPVSTKPLPTTSKPSTTTLPVSTSPVSTTPVITTSKPPTTTPPVSSPYTITIQSYIFFPPTLTVPVGTTVVWINKDADDHTATSDATPAVFDVPVKGNGGSGRFTFDKAGTYPYHCAFHTAMFGTIIVV